MGGVGAGIRWRTQLFVPCAGRLPRGGGLLGQFEDNDPLCAALRAGNCDVGG